MKEFHCQVWLEGHSLCDVTVYAKNEREAKEKARKYMREWLEVKRLPKDTSVNIIPPNYYDQIVRENKRIGIDATNW